MSYLKRLTNAALGRLQAFRMYGGIGMSASSLHRESTDSLIYKSLSSSIAIQWVLLGLVWSSPELSSSSKLSGMGGPE